MIYVVDASAAVEYLLQTAIGVQISSTLESADLVAPALLDVEVLAVLRRETRLGRVDPERAVEAIDDLVDWPLKRLDHGPLLHGAWQLRGHITAYDAMYVEAARSYACPLLTADGPLARAPGLGIVVQNVRATEA